MSQSITLYSFADVDRSSRPRWLLSELGLEAQEKRLGFGEHKSDAYRQVNPFGLVPAIQQGDTSLFESGAICLYLADTYGAGKLAPPAGAKERAEYYQWVVFAAATLNPAVFKIFGPGVQFTQEQLNTHRAFLKPTLDVLEAHLAKRSYVLASGFSTADILIGHTLGMAGRFGLLSENPGLVAYVTRLETRDGAVKAKLFSSPLPGAAPTVKQ